MYTQFLSQDLQEIKIWLSISLTCQHLINSIAINALDLDDNFQFHLQYIHLNVYLYFKYNLK
jgi:hypothetical protein